MNWELAKTIATEIGVIVVGIGSILTLVSQALTIKKLRAENKELKRKQQEEVSAIIRPTPGEIAQYSEEARRIIKAVRAERDEIERMRHIVRPLPPLLPNQRMIPVRRRSVIGKSLLIGSFLFIFIFKLSKFVRFPTFFMISILVIALTAVLFVSLAEILDLKQEENLLSLWLISRRRRNSKQIPTNELDV